LVDRLVFESETCQTSWKTCEEPLTKFEEVLHLD